MWRVEPISAAQALRRAVLAGAIVAGWLLRVRRRPLARSRPNIRSLLARRRRSLALVAGGACLIVGWSLAVTLLRG